MPDNEITGITKLVNAGRIVSVSYVFFYINKRINKEGCVTSDVIRNLCERDGSLMLYNWATARTSASLFTNIFFRFKTDNFVPYTVTKANNACYISIYKNNNIEWKKNTIYIYIFMSGDILEAHAFNDVIVHLGCATCSKRTMVPVYRSPNYIRVGSPSLPFWSS